MAMRWAYAFVSLLRRKLQLCSGCAVCFASEAAHFLSYGSSSNRIGELKRSLRTEDFVWCWRNPRTLTRELLLCSLGQLRINMLYWYFCSNQQKCLCFFLPKEKPGISWRAEKCIRKLYTISDKDLPFPFYNPLCLILNIINEKFDVFIQFM